MNYNETLEYLYNKLPMFSKIGSDAYKKDLTNTRILCERLDDPHKKFKSVHIGGTNGKGSTSHMLAAILQTAGYKTGLYTSPHLKDFRERIKVNGEMISEEFVIEFTRKVMSSIDEISPSFFEITVAMAFDYFAQEKVDIAVIEVGLGGRLDSTNILLPEVAVITNIGYDHMNILGDTLELIAKEKAGIIKPMIPVVIGETTNETKSVFETTAEEKNAPISFADQKKHIAEWKWVDHQLVADVSMEHRKDGQQYHLDLIGLYQTKNLLTVLETCSQLVQKGWLIEEKHIKKALKQVVKLTGLHGRWQVVHRNPAVVLDVAHNVAGMDQLLKQVEVTDHTDLHIIIGMVRDKEIDEVLKLLPPHASYYFTQAQIPRALPSEQLADKASAFNLIGEAYADVNIALEEAIRKSAKQDLVLVCGSVFLVGEVNIGELVTT